MAIETAAWPGDHVSSQLQRQTLLVADSGRHLSVRLHFSNLQDRAVGNAALVGRCGAFHRRRRRHRAHSAVAALPLSARLRPPSPLGRAGADRAVADRRINGLSQYRLAQLHPGQGRHPDGLHPADRGLDVAAGAEGKNPPSGRRRPGPGLLRRRCLHRPEQAGRLRRRRRAGAVRRRLLGGVHAGDQEATASLSMSGR